MSPVPWLSPMVQKEKDGIYSLDFITSSSKERFHTLSPLCKRGYLINPLMTDILSLCSEEAIEDAGEHPYREVFVMRDRLSVLEFLNKKLQDDEVLQVDF